MNLSSSGAEDKVLPECANEVVLIERTLNEEELIEKNLIENSK